MPPKRKRGKQTPGDEKRHKGWTLPGYNYIGPGNSLENGVPTDADDIVAQNHDYAYQDYIDEGQDPYFNYSEADEKARQEFGKGWGGYLGKAYFTAKKGAYKVGLIGHTKERYHYSICHGQLGRHTY